MGTLFSSSASEGSEGNCTSQVFLNVYDLTPLNSYTYWFGLGIFHSGIEGEISNHQEIRKKIIDFFVFCFCFIVFLDLGWICFLIWFWFWFCGCLLNCLNWLF